ncbi:MAG TPA: enoyl-CoA hydratase-related protein, partial [Pyrinomonadaceae bacterium]
MRIEASEAGAIIVEERDSLAIVRLNRPAERNSLSRSTLEELEQAVSALTNRRELTAIIFTGTGDVFASGA